MNAGQIAMSFHAGRRAVLAGTAAVLAPAVSRAAAASAARAGKTAEQRIAAIERRDGGRLGVAIFDSGSGLFVGHRSEQRFPMCSTYKFLAAASVLRRVDAGEERLSRKIPYRPSDLLGYAPVTKAHVEDGSMSLADLCAAAVQWSDNTAGNLLLQAIGGPAGLTRYARSLGDPITRLDRNEPTLNTAIPGDERDTTSPRSMLHDMQAVLLGTALSPRSRQQLETWMVGDQVGAKRLRAGLPAAWRIGDKTGSGDHGTANTLAIMWPPDRPPILAAVYQTGSPAPADTLDAAHAEIGRIIADGFRGSA